MQKLVKQLIYFYMLTCGDYCRSLSALACSSSWLRKYSWGFSFHILVLDQQLSRALDGEHARYIEFCSLRSSELSSTKIQGSLGFAKKNFTYVSKTLICQTFLLPKFFLLYSTGVYMNEVKCSILLHH